MVYIHIPFCVSFCIYCDFYSETASSGKYPAGFSDAICREIAGRRDEIEDRINTLYIGGGTPSVLPLSVLARIVDAAGNGRYDEFTVEVNPEDIVRKGEGYVRGLAALGVDRVSMGVQSFDDGMLKWMNRRHDADTAREAYRILRSAGIGNVGIDLIFGISHLGDEVWSRTLDEAVRLEPEHISAYQLSIEPGSALAGMVCSGKYMEAPEDQCRRQYDMLCERFGAAGYRHYEISNFARPGYEAVHNSAYWRHEPYSGFGPGAHSFRIDGDKYIRSWNLPDLKHYVEYYTGAAGECRDIRQRETLTPEQIAIEKLMLGLRTDAGVSRDFLYLHSDKGTVDRMVAEGLLVAVTVPAVSSADMPPEAYSGNGHDNRLRIPEKYFFISDSIISDLV